MTETRTTAGPLSILIVDDEANIRRILSISLQAKGHKVIAVSNFQDAVTEAARQSFDLAFVDIRLGADDGLDLIPLLLASTPWLRIVVITAYSSVSSAVEAMRRGATDYISKPFTTTDVNLVVRQVAEVRSLEQKVTGLEEELARSMPEPDFSSASPIMQQAVNLARAVARSEVTVLLRGESGTGKSALARRIHYWSDRVEKPFGVISCPTLSPELLESELFGHAKGAFTGAIRNYSGRVAACEGSTLLLDEIGDLPMPVQPKLLRFIQEREYERVGDHITRKANVRIIAATNLNLEQLVREGRFRQDLFYRLNVVPITIPPLRERHEDVSVLAEDVLAFVGRRNRRRLQGFTDEAVEALKEYEWPGNVRELGNVVERAAILCKSDRVGAEHLPLRAIPRKNGIKPGDSVSLKQIEEEHIRRVLARSKSLHEAAKILGIDLTTLWRRRRQYNI